MCTYLSPFSLDFQFFENYEAKLKGKNVEASQDKINQWGISDFLVRCYLVPDKDFATIYPRFVALPVSLDQRKSLPDWHVAKEVSLKEILCFRYNVLKKQIILQDPGYPCLSFFQSKSYAIKWVPRRKTETCPAFGLPSYPVFLGCQPVDPKKAVRAIRKLMAAVPAAYVVTRASFNNLTRAPGVVTKNIVSPLAWPALVQTEPESEDEEGKILFSYKSGVVTAI